MAPRNSMRTETHFLKKGKFWSKIRPKSPNREGSYKTICKVETMKDIVDGSVDFYNLVFHFI